MKTADYQGKGVPVIEPDAEDRKNPVVAARLWADKGLERAPAECRLPQGVAAFVAARHSAGTLTLVIANTVKRAIEIRAALEKKTDADVRLLHSRFRAVERSRHVEAVVGALREAGRIVVATQVIEAGIDLDAHLMVTDIAPYPSMVQRFGRVNRKGERKGCRIYWVDRPLTTKQKALGDSANLAAKEQEKVFAPYAPVEVQRAMDLLKEQSSAAPADLPELKGSPMPWKHVLRRADLLDLFDTSSDLGGNEIDISRFVRSDPERDVYVYWRTWEGKVPQNVSGAAESELCPAPIGDMQAKAVWTWNTMDGRWERPETLYPGMTVLLHSSDGKYSTDFGWWPESTTPVPSAGAATEEPEQNNDDRKMFTKYRQTLAAHTDQVCDEMQLLIEGLTNLGIDSYREALKRAARLHDWGKAHPIMQETLQATKPPYSELLAKQAGSRKHRVRFFRHELASALAMLAAGESDLSAYVAAAHHGRIRVVVRSMPGERFLGGDRVRGIKEGERLLSCSLGGGVDRQEVELSLAAAQLGFRLDGSASWTERVLRLREELGPFRLAYLEMLLRLADESASAKAEKEATA
jgi:CRISPR-associated endonuclease/helicase Cas3